MLTQLSPHSLLKRAHFLPPFVRSALHGSIETGALEGTLEGSCSLEVQCVGQFESNEAYWQGRPVLTRPDLAAAVDLFAALRSLALPVDRGKAKAGNAAGL